MATITKKELIDQIAEASKKKRVDVKRIVQSFLDSIIVELGKGNRLEFRDFGVFEVKQRKARKAQNPKTMEKVDVPPKRTVKFKVGRLMKQTLSGEPLPNDAAGTEAGLLKLAAASDDGEEEYRPERDGVAPGRFVSARERLAYGWRQYGETTLPGRPLS